MGNLKNWQCEMSHQSYLHLNPEGVLLLLLIGSIFIFLCCDTNHCNHFSHSSFWTG